MNRISAFKTIILESIFSRKCVICGETLSVRTYGGLRKDRSFDGLCGECRAQVKYIAEPVCMKCGKEIDDYEQEYCYDCKHTVHIFDKGMALYKYSDDIRKSIYRFKYCNHRRYGEFYGQEMYDRYRGFLQSWKPDVIIPVPVHKKRLRKRGYNQAELIADALSHLSGIPVDKYILQRIKNTKPQKELDKAGRRKNTESAFKVMINVVRYNKVLLIDDIYTTGCTIDACANVLKQSGIRSVNFITICIGEGI